MATYGLWYFKAQDGSYGTFPSAGTPSQLEDRGFTYAVALHSSAKDENGNLLYGNIPFSGYSYNDGYQDGASLGRWVDPILRGIDYLVVIPVLIDESRTRGVRGIQYWKGWVDGVYNNTSGYQVGFYWYLEYPWQVSDGIVYEEDIQEISAYIRNKGQQFIWIPYFHYSYPDHISDITKTDIGLLAKYFTYVFIQPNYYQGTTRTLQDFNVVYNQIEELKEENNLSNIFMEMECDGRVRSPDPGTAVEYRERACAYVSYTKDYPHRAYYYDTNLQNIQKMEEYCNDRGKRYVF
ncbi:DUF4855 domain-containing protein [Thermococcus sp. LS1]|uniref:DUF4855 domain-containing protein n=1 Tax=Thermococcus sp. LS1 TaxID=1638259 RepID=UPI001438AC02|nr:DUF4855 domain-containing protein [Thermococcus sp. LS1]NJE00066.1 DUF4855 domain-containing protein [Thermococcus sp. LS1]